MAEIIAEDNRILKDPAPTIKVVELAHDEFDRVPRVLDEFAEELDEMGPNPLKGF